MPFIGFGSCGGNCACSTCMVILTPEHFKRVDRINPASEEENDLLDEAPEMTDYSRLACQVNYALGCDVRPRQSRGCCLFTCSQVDLTDIVGLCGADDRCTRK
ncbi:unnamed protein product [Cylicostephanus goldi]|uniref:Uncharacterized protein n=1 Tax=Cylicostephanus goldi TaxID=71465 RepID=A0A3P6RQV2_CYLGO|nr:unnamed protein product [Cylicostephanus goldi]